MRLMILPLLLSIVFIAPSAAWEMRGNIYPVENGVIEWTADSFAGFVPTGPESLRFNISNEQVEAGDAVYQTGIQEKDFAHREWGCYSALSFSGQEYFAGYPEGCRIGKPMSLLSPEGGTPDRVLIDSDESYTIASGEPLPLQEGYSLKLSDAEDGINISLYKEGNLIDSRILSVPSDYIFNTSIDNETAALIAVGIKANVRLEPTSFYTIKGLFQLSENTQSIDIGREFKEMLVAAISDSGVELDNLRALRLSNGQDFELMDGIRIRTSEINASSNQLYIYRDSTETDAPEIRGEIAADSFSWTPRNFAGFYYSMKDDLGTEEISTTVTEGNRLEEPSSITYTTTAQQKDFEFTDWGRYSTISFLGERFLAGYMGEGPLCAGSESSLLAYEKLGRVLIDSSEHHLIADGANLSLEDGMVARIYADKSCNSTFIELYKNGALIDRDYFHMPDTYTYRKTFEGNGDGFAFLAIHIAGADCSRKKSIMVDGIFQISEDLVDVSVDRSFGKMRICTVYCDGSGGGISMDNKDNTIILNRNLDTVLAGDYHIKAMDTEALRYYIYEPVSV
jgi:S-layer protein (TIGR01567 family)